MSDTLSIGPEVATWAIKDFSVTLRQQITSAARRQDCNVAEWLHAYFHRHGIEGQQFDLMKMTQSAPSAPLDLMAIAGNPELPRWVRAAASRKIGEQLGVSPPVGPPEGPPRRLKSPETAE